MPNKPKAFDVVRAHIEERILDGTLTIDDVLPAERDLAVELGVSRGAVREAIRALEAQGVLESSVGAGRAGGTRVIRARTRALTRLLRLHVALAGRRLAEVVELRVALERSSVTLAVGTVTPERLDEMRALLEAMRAGVDMPTFNRLDTDFHVAIAKAAANSLVTDLTIAVRESLRGPILTAEKRLAGEGGYEEFRDMLCDQHEGIFAAIEAGDGALAADRIEAHIRAAYSALPGMTASRAN